MGKNIYLCVREARVMMGAKLLHARIRTQTYEMKSILFFFCIRFYYKYATKFRTSDATKINQFCYGSLRHLHAYVTYTYYIYKMSYTYTLRASSIFTLSRI